MTTQSPNGADLVRHDRSADKSTCFGPHHVDASAYDIVYVFADAMKRSAVTGDADKVRAERTASHDALMTANMDGVIGKICLSKDKDLELRLSSSASRTVNEPCSTLISPTSAVDNLLKTPGSWPIGRAAAKS